MTAIIPPLDERGLLRRHGIRPRHRLGQNFLHDAQALSEIVAAAELSGSDSVLEVGCGLGSLTRFLATVAGSVVALEVDPKLAAIARDSLSGLRNVRIVCADILEVDLGDLALPSGYIVAANIPYYLTSAIIRLFLESETRPRRLVLTVQKEVAQRICAEPPEMSILAVSVQVYGRPRIVAEIPATAFIPVPKVDSAVVRIDCHQRPTVPPGLKPIFFRVLRAGFSQPRKMLRNTLSSGLSAPAADVQSLLSGVGIDPRRRPQTLSVEEWIRLSQAATNVDGGAS
jgi:16S rRNA (adenine1518-N6/adenine1519-N6)-dimethyltransferase